MTHINLRILSKAEAILLRNLSLGRGQDRAPAALVNSAYEHCVNFTLCRNGRRLP